MQQASVKDKIPDGDKESSAFDNSLTTGDNVKSLYCRESVFATAEAEFIERKKVLMALFGINTLVRKMAPHNAQAAINYAFILRFL